MVKPAAFGNGRMTAFVVSCEDARKIIHLIRAWQSILKNELQDCPDHILKPLLSPHEEADLISLWAKRSELVTPEWNRLWNHLTKVLTQCRPAVLKQLPESHEDYIHSFILNKVFQDRHTSPPLHSAAALATFFKNYLIDVQRYEARRPVTYLNDEATLDHFSEGCDESPTPDAVSTQGDPVESSHSNQLLKSAASFVNDLCHEDQIYLSLHACDDEGEALYKIAAKYNIASYHYKAGQLGITRKKGELPDGYEKTRIGAWMTKSLGLRIAAECIDEILDAFEALCGAASAIRESLLAEVRHA